MKMTRVLLLVSCLLCWNAVPAAGQKSERDSALALANQGRNGEAIPLLERLVASDSTDTFILEKLGLSLLKVSATYTDPASRRQQRVRARSMFEKAVRLGSKSEQIRALVESMPADGGVDPTYSANAGVDDAMQKAEAAFSAGDYRLAFTLYQKALALDPNLYTAALFSGDTYVHTPNVDSAYVWYARATQINPDRETAWRYWSDVLLKNGNVDEAGVKAIETMIAEPYSRFSRSALSSWAEKAKVQVGFPRISLAPGTAASPSAPARLAYDSVRSAFKGADETGGTAFRTAYPSETKYRHSLREELAALQAAYRVDPANSATINLRKMDEAGVLESFVLIAGADEGVSQDYVDYRRSHRDNIRKFWTAFVIGAPYK